MGGDELILKAHLPAIRRTGFYPIPGQRTKFTARSVQQIVSAYAAAAELPEHVHPHLLRQSDTHVVNGVAIARRSDPVNIGPFEQEELGGYQHLSLAQVEAGYQRVVKQLEI